MSKISIKLPDNSIKEYESGITLKDIASSISEGLARVVVGAVFNENILGLNEKITEDGSLKFVKFDDKEGKEVFWHTSSHVMALAIKRLFPEVKFAIGPAIENGFYYDIDLDYKLTPEDLPKIEAEMEKIIKEGADLKKSVVSREEALKFFENNREPYKVELINSIEDDKEISFYSLGEFTDLCRGPHLLNTSKIKAIKLLSIAGAYWRGDENNKMLQRIYGISFEKKKDLDEYLNMLEEAKERDHRKLGKELEIFMVNKDIGAGFPFWLLKGATIRRIIERYIVDKELKYDYNHVYTPIMANVNLYKTSGHWQHYKDSMFPPMNLGDGEMLVYSDRKSVV